MSMRDSGAITTATARGRDTLAFRFAPEKNARILAAHEWSRMRPLLFAILLLLAFTAQAHHSPASFDQSVEVVIEGTVAELTWANPHTYFAVETVGPGGEPTLQQVEASPISGLTTFGVTRESLRTGDRVSVRANPNRRGAGYTVLGIELTKTDGAVMPLHPRAARSSRVSGEATSIFGTWVGQPEGFVAATAAVRSWPVTQHARDSMAGDRRDLATANSECVPAGLPGLMTLPTTITLVAQGSAIGFTIDWLGAQRTVHLDEQHPVTVEPTPFGHSVGKWEGGALLVDTVGFTAQAQGMAPGFPSSEAKHVVERFSLSEDRKHIEYEATVEDPAYLTLPVTVKSRWDYRPGQASSTEPCDPTLARRFLSD
jgi:hypothetical protein